MNKEYRIQEIKEDIHYYRKLITSLEKKIKTSEKQIEELDETYKKYMKVNEEYNEFQYAQKQQAKTLESKFRNIKFSKKLAVNLNKSVNGSKAKKSLYGIEKTVNNITRKCEETERDIREYQNDIRSYSNRIDDLEYELRNLMWQ